MLLTEEDEITRRSYRVRLFGNEFIMIGDFFMEFY